MRPTIGDQIARIRRALPITQEQLAERADISVETIRELEQGERTSARMATLNAIARALGTSTSSLIGDASTAAARAEPDHRPLSLMELRRALTPARGPAGTIVTDFGREPPALEVIRTHLRDADRAYHRGDYAAALAALPDVLRDAEAAAAAAPEGGRARAHALLAQSRYLTGELLIQLRAGDLAYCALTTALDAARIAGDEVLGTSVVKGLTWLLLRQGRFEESGQLAIDTADAVEPRFSRARPEELAVWGWLQLAAAAAAARDNRPSDATSLLDSAAAAAARIGDRPASDDHLLIVGGFRSGRVEMMRVEAAAVAHEPAQVLNLADRVSASNTVATSWRRHRLDVAWAHAQLGQWPDATAVLLDLRERAPAWLRHQRYARDIVSTIATGRRRVMGQELADLAALVGAGS